MKTKRIKTIVLAIGLIGICVALVAAVVLTPFGGRGAVKGTSYETVSVKTGDIRETVSGTGTLTAVGTVNVLTQITGTVEHVYVDYNDRVKKGQPLAACNTAMLKISLKEAEASLFKARVELEHNQLQFEYNTKLFERKLISEFDLHTIKTGYDTSRASVLSAEAQHERAMLNLKEYAVVLSPITGVVLDRKVDEGQTVVAGASSDTQTMFTLAESLANMEIEVKVDEMDISRIVVGQTVGFTVSTHSDTTFIGKVSQIHLVPTTSNDVVKYTIVVRAENKDGLLLPGMTATADFIVSEKKNALTVANSALRFKPSAEVESAAMRRMLEERLKDGPAEERAAVLKQFDGARKSSTAAAAARQPSGGNALLGGSFQGGPPPGMQKQETRSGAAVAAANGQSSRTLWLLGEDGQLSPRQVRVGATDGTNTELLESSDLEGRSVVTKSK